MAVTKPTGFRLTEEDLVLLDAIGHHTGIRSRSEALRALLRYYVRAEGVAVPKRKPPPKSRP
jgi:hypothetical protein